MVELFKMTACRSLDMCATCLHVAHMSKMIQLRSVPDALHRKLKARAAVEGMTLSDYLTGELRRIAERPTAQELKARLEARTEVTLRTPPARAVRQERDRR